MKYEFIPLTAESRAWKPLFGSIARESSGLQVHLVQVRVLVEVRPSEHYVCTTTKRRANALISG